MSTDKKDTNVTEDKKQAIAGELISGLEAMIRPDMTQHEPPKKQAEKPPAGLMFNTLPPRKIDIDKVEGFLDTVFHTGLEDDEHLLTWVVDPRSRPAYPKSENDMYALMDKTKHQKALYFGTATFTPCAKDGKLYNRQENFRSLRLVVLDDIGTKVAVDKIPKDFKPSYILESSKGNFQYGYVLTEPVTDVDAAGALIELIYESEFSDEGGKMPNKIVRLPEGVNGKKGEKEGFICNLHEINNTTYTPQEIIDSLSLAANWDTILEDAAESIKRRGSVNTGATPWASTQPKAPSLNGIVDPVLEWLYEEDLVGVDNGGAFVDIKCPWSDAHSDGNPTAGYMPLGRGDNPNMRGFHCFHDSCASNKTPEFLKYIAAAAGIEAAQSDPAAHLTSQYVLNVLDGSVYDVKSEVRGMNLKRVGFNSKFSRSMTVYTGEGKEKKITAHKMWELSPTRVDVTGAVYDPATPARLVEQNGERYINLFYQPKWGEGEIDHKEVKWFTDYLEYFIPDEAMRNYFEQWLAAKIQNMAFRGAAIVMTANKQGVGRSTLVDMIKTLLGEDNAADMSLSKLIKESEFNEWAAKPFISVEETKTIDGSEFYSSYETLKTLIDPRSKKVTINQKYGMKFTTDMLASFMFLTNHADAIQLPAEDRRFCVMANPSVPAKPEFFTSLNKWLTKKDVDGMPYWGRHVYRWLKTIDVDMEKLTAPPPRSDAKMAMVNAAKSDINFTIGAVIESWPDPYINTSEVIAVLSTQTIVRRVEFDPQRHKKLVTRMVNGVSSGYKDVTIKNKNLTKRPRVIDEMYLDPDITTVLKPTTKEESAVAKAQLSEAYIERKLDIEAIALAVEDLLNAADR